VVDGEVDEEAGGEGWMREFARAIRTSAVRKSGSHAGAGKLTFLARHIRALCDMDVPDPHVETLEESTEFPLKYLRGSF